MQSSTNTQQNPTTTTTENVMMSDNLATPVIDHSTFPDPTRYDGSLENGSYESFLARPVQISSTTWSETATLQYLIYPWHLWASNPQIKSKLQNFSLFRGNLHLKLMINASPFYYGLGKISYRPLIGVTNSFNVEVNSALETVAYSQMPGGYFYPQSCEGTEFKAPFLWHKNWVNLTSAQEFKDLGMLDIRQIVPLQNANSVSTGDVTITIFAWVTDVELSGPTYSLPLQSEYKKLGPISGPASAVAKAARALAAIPPIAPYALATEMISTKVGDIAKYFGFTNVPNTSAQTAVQPASHFGMASCEISTPYEKLALDDKNELSIDPRIVGIEPRDELVISNFISRESIIWVSPWASTDAPGTSLFNAWVTPDYFRIAYPTGVTARQMTPLALLNKMFLNWRGTIIFRFRIVCSKFHKGRLRITFDPNANLSTISSAELITTSYVKIVDISDTSEVEFEVPYLSAYSYLRTTAGEFDETVWMNTTGALNSLGSDFRNGTINVSVLNHQTSPVTSSDISIVTSVRAGSDFEFANPAEVPQNYSYLRPQSGFVETNTTTETLSNDLTSSSTGNLNLIHFGEKVVSLRQLMHRRTYYTTVVCKNGTDGNTSAQTLNKFVLPRVPQPYGYVYNENAIMYCPRTIGTGNSPANMVSNSVFSLLAPCFAGMRGSFVYTLNVIGSDPTYQVEISRGSRLDRTLQASDQGFNNPVSRSTYQPSSLGTLSRNRINFVPNGTAGRTMTNQLTQSGLTALLPLYAPLRFVSPVDYTSTETGTWSPSRPSILIEDTLTITTVHKPSTTGTADSVPATSVDLFYMTGPDFNLYYFMFVPTFYKYHLPFGTVN